MQPSGDPKFGRSEVPHILVGPLPVEHRGAVSALIGILHDLCSEVDDLSACASLHAESEWEISRIKSELDDIRAAITGVMNRQILPNFQISPMSPDRSFALMAQRTIVHRWSILANRMSAIIMWDIKRLIEAIPDFVEACHVFEDRIDLGLVREQCDQFDKEFPKCEQSRHAAAHAAELQVANRASGQHAITDRLNNKWIKKSGKSGVFIANAMFDGSLVSSRRGELLKQNSLEDLISKVCAIEGRIYSAFKSIDAKQGCPFIPVSPNAPDPA